MICLFCGKDTMECRPNTWEPTWLTGSRKNNYFYELFVDCECMEEAYTITRNGFSSLFSTSTTLKKIKRIVDKSREIEI